MKRPYSRVEAPVWRNVAQWRKEPSARTRSEPEPRESPLRETRNPPLPAGSRTDPRGKGTPGKRLPGLGKIPANFSRLSAHHVTAAERERHFPRGRGRFLRGRKHHICLG